MSFYIPHPVEWVGVPEYWPFPWQAGQHLATEQEWVAALVSELEAANGLDAEQAEWLRMVALLAAHQAVRSGGRTFFAVETWEGPAYIALCLIESDSVIGGRSLEQYAGYDDPEQIGAPFAESFESDSGLIGVRCFRYVPYEGQLGSISGRVDYAFRAGDSVLRLTGAQLDLVLFERMKPLMELLARSICWRD